LATDEYWVNDLELGNGKGSHHLIVSAAIPGSPAEAKIRQMKVGDQVACLNVRLPFGEEGIVDIAATQTPYNRTKLANGVGAKYYGGQAVVFDYHFINLSTETIHTLSAINVHTTDASNVQHQMSGLSFTNYTIDTPPKTSQSFMAECHLKTAVMIGALGRHTHKFGTDFDVWFSGGAHDGEHIWTSKDWEEETQYEFPTPILMKAGEGFRFQCSYTNPGTKDLRFGTSARDEMCILAGSIWAATVGEELETQSCNIVWNDSNGVGHPADEAGGVPKAPALTSLTCELGSGSDTECKRCTCESCGTPSLACALDPDCLAILQCVGDCVTAGGTGTDCAVQCQPTISAHSSGVGLSRQAQSCISANCNTCAN
jgi:hypothetical protein